MTALEMRRPRWLDGADAETKQQIGSILRRRDDEVEELLATTARHQKEASAIADDPTTTLRAKCLALLELNRRARAEAVLPGVAEAAVWGGCRDLFSETVPRDPLRALRRLHRRGLKQCPVCRRDVPDRAELERWMDLEIRNLRRK